MSEDLTRSTEPFYDTTYAGKRDLYDALGYKRRLTVKDYRDRYRRGGIAKTIIETFPSLTWSGPISVVENPDTDTSTPWETLVSETFNRLKVQQQMMNADILAGLGRYACLLIGAPGDLSTPIPNVGSEGILYLKPLAEDNAKIVEDVTDSNDTRYGMPLFYSVKISRNTSKVHYSRIVHICEGIESDIYGAPRLEACWNDLDDLDKIKGGGAEGAWRRADPGLQADVDPTIQMSPTDERKFSDQIDAYLHGLARVMKTRGVKMNLLPSDVSSYGGNLDATLKLISGTTRIPVRILVGSERGELASSQDRDNLNDRVAERRDRFAYSWMRDLIDRFILCGAFPPVKNYALIPPNQRKLTESEKADVVVKLAKANKDQKDTGEPVIVSSQWIVDNILA